MAKAQKSRTPISPPILILAGLVICAMGVIVGIGEQLDWRRWPHAQGRIVALRTDETDDIWPCSTEDCPEVEFELAERLIRREAQDDCACPPKYQIGQRIEIAYEPRYANLIMLKPRHSWMDIILALAGAWWVYVGMAGLAGRSR